MNHRGIFLPASARATLATLSPSELLALETHLDNLRQIAEDPARFFEVTSTFERENGRLIVDVGSLRVRISLDPYTRILYVHRVERMSPPAALSH